MNKINIKDLYLIFGNEKQKALRLLKEGKSKSEILKAIHICFDGFRNNTMYCYNQGTEPIYLQ